MKTDYSYNGKELQLFGMAINWKKYVRSKLYPFIKGEVAEVGAGTGNFTPYLQTPLVNSWTYIEPDHSLCQSLQKKIDQQRLPAGKIFQSWQMLPANIQFDTILYMDVLEHIDNDKKEVNLMVERLHPGGSILLVTPAHPMLYSPFDKEIGHYRRYNKKSLTNLFEDKKQIILCQYLDSAGFFTSLANRYLLKQKYPTEKQIKTWDSLLVPLSGLSDRFLFHSFGRSLILVWQKLKGQNE